MGGLGREGGGEGERREDRDRKRGTKKQKGTDYKRKR